MLSIRTNITSLQSQRHLNSSTQKISQNFGKASSGHRISQSSDDAAGVSISDRLMIEVRGRNKALQSTQDGLNLLNIADGSLSSINESIQRIRELTVQAANDTNATAEREAIVKEVQQRLNDINRIAQTSRFNTSSLLDGSATQFKVQVGVDSNVTENTINIGTALQNAQASALGFSAALNITAAAGGILENGTSARSFLDTIDTAIKNLNNIRGNVGSLVNRLEGTIQSTSLSIENYSKSYSKIKDADIAQVTSEITKDNILRDSAMSILAQSNSAPGLALSLIS